MDKAGHDAGTIGGEMSIDQRLGVIERILLGKLAPTDEELVATRSYMHSGCDEAIMPELSEKVRAYHRDQDAEKAMYAQEREIGRMGRDEREKAQAFRNERASAAMNRIHDQIESPRLEAILGRIYEFSAQADGIQAVLGNFADRTVGPVPEEASGRGGVEAMPDGIVDRIDLALCHLGNRLNMIEIQHNRVSRL